MAKLGWHTDKWGDKPGVVHLEIELSNGVIQITTTDDEITIIGPYKLIQKIPQQAINVIVVKILG